MSRSHARKHGAAPQRGTALFVSLLILLVLSLFAVVMANTSVGESRSANTAAGAQFAQFAADSALSGAEIRVRSLAKAKGAGEVCAQLRCVVRDSEGRTAPASFMANARATSLTSTFDLIGAQPQENGDAIRLVAQPIYAVEDLGVLTARGAQDGTARSVHVFRITAQGWGAATDQTRIVEKTILVDR